jgi:hypothetical protein
MPVLAEEVVRKAALRLVEETARFRAVVRDGVAQADHGELIDDDEVRQWLERQDALETDPLDSTCDQLLQGYFVVYRRAFGDTRRH